MEKIIPLVSSLREEYGVGPVCHELAVAPSTYYYYHHQQRLCNPERCSDRDNRDDLLKPEIQRVYEENCGVYGSRKVWRQLLREGVVVARCTVERLMKVMGLSGVLRGKEVRKIVSRKENAPHDMVNREFRAELMWSTNTGQRIRV